MNRFKDAHAGETAIVIGNGPSLRRTPPELLHKYRSFGSNRVYLLPFTPTYFTVINPLVVAQFADEILQVQSEAIFLPEALKHIGGSAHWLTSIYEPHFSKDPSRGIYEGHTVTFVNLQLAYWMGFTTVLLVGVDHRYTYRGEPNQRATMAGADPNHFAPDYFGPGVQWNNPDLKRSEAAYQLARDTFEDAGRRIINLTPGTALGIFERESWRKWL